MLFEFAHTHNHKPDTPSTYIQTMADLSKPVADAAANAIAKVVNEVRRHYPNAKVVYGDTDTCMFALPPSELQLLSRKSDLPVGDTCKPNLGLINKKSYRGLGVLHQ